MNQYIERVLNATKAKNANEPEFLQTVAISWALVPAERTSWPPLPGCISMLWITVPTGMLARGRETVIQKTSEEFLC